MLSKKVTVYWTPGHEAALQAVVEKMKAQGIPCERDGKPNVSSVILFALQQTSKGAKDA